jgi:hypothetical protein
VCLRRVGKEMDPPQEVSSEDSMTKRDGPERGIDTRALDSAKDKLRIAREKTDAMRAATNLADLARLWEEFLA